jgi:hypothetical protein
MYIIDPAITIKPLDSNLDLYTHYSGQINPQSCYIEFDPCDGVVSASSNSEIGNAVPMYVWHGIVRRYHLPYAIYGTSYVALAEEIKPLLARVQEGFEEVWDGSNHVGTLTDDAQTAENEIEAAIESWCDESDAIKVWDASDWLQGETNADLGITATTADDELEAISDKIRNDAVGEADIIDGLDSHLQRRRDDEIEAVAN